MKGLAALSGGVDSAVAAALLCEEGHGLTGVTMRLLDASLLGGPQAVQACAMEAAIEGARATCQQLGIPHLTLDLAAQFRSCVVEPFCRAYLEGRTPNPCIECNRHLKIAELQRLRRQRGLDFVATGHYARVRFDQPTGRWQLLRAADKAKDQSYVLYRAGQDDLAHLRLPLGNLAKGDVRALAAELGLPGADAPESQDICFVPDGDYTAFIERYAGTGAEAALDLRALEPGPIVDAAGTVRGTHSGIARYTVGQRKGLGLAAAEPLYVCGKDAATNTLRVGTAAQARGTRVVARDASMVSVAALDGPARVQAKTHYRQEPQPATATQPDAGTLVVEFDEPQRLAAAGQSLVIYDGDVVLGGGTIA